MFLSDVYFAQTGKQPKVQIRQAQMAQSKVISELVGTWKLVSYEVQRPNGELLYPYGQKAAGRLIYDVMGHMAVQIMHPDRPKAERGKATTAEMQAAYGGYVAYFGTYSVTVTGDTIVHHVEGSLDTWRLGVDQVRPLELSDDHLILRAEFTTDDELRRYKITWERLK